MILKAFINRVKRKVLHIRLQPIHVYCFHHVSEAFDVKSMNACDWVQSDVFKDVISDLMNDKVVFISLTEAFHHIRKDFFRTRHFAVLAFDDGYASLMEILPWLEEHRIPVTLFINGKYLDGCSYRDNPKEQYLTYKDLFHLSSPLVEIASHGWEHTDATVQPGQAFAEDIVNNIRLLSQHQRFIPFHAYTWGRHNDVTDEVLRKMEIIPVLMDGAKNYNDARAIHRELLCCPE